LTDSLSKTGVLSGTIRIPDTAGLLVVSADLRAGQVTCHVDVDAPREGRPTTRVNWLVRQLRNAPELVRLEAYANHARGASTAELLRTVRENPACLVADPSKDLRSFRVAVSTPLGTKRGRGRGAFIDSVLTAVNGFYADVLESLRPWAAAPPKLRPAHPTPPDIDEAIPASLSSTDYSSQDEVDEVRMPEAPGPERAKAGSPAHGWADEEAPVPEPRPDEMAVGETADEDETDTLTPALVDRQSHGSLDGSR
jgi:hypothetical protein